MDLIGTPGALRLLPRLRGQGAVLESTAPPAAAAGGVVSGAATIARAPHILLVEDERALREALAYTLRRNGFDVHSAENADAALAAARNHAPDLVLLDVLLPGSMDGFEVCRRLRHELRAPIILVSARAEEVDRVVGLEVGADDYVAKPFSIVELLARIKAHLRRTAMDAEHALRERTAAGSLIAPRKAPQGPLPALRVGDLLVDPGTREVRLAGGKPLHLKRRQFDLLHYLAQHAGQTLSRSQLLHAIWPDVALDEQDTRTVDVHVHRVRKAIERDPEHPRCLVTVRGVGYVLQAHTPEKQRGKK